MADEGGKPLFTQGRDEPATAEEAATFQEGTDRLFMWAWEQSFTAAVSGEVAVAPELLDVADWEVAYFQIDVIETSAAPGDFSWNLSTALEDVDTPNAWALVNASFVNLPGTGESSVLRVSKSSQTPLRRWASWKVRHNAAGVQRVRFQIKVLFKRRAAPPQVAMRVLSRFDLAVYWADLGLANWAVAMLVESDSQGEA